LIPTAPRNPGTDQRETSEVQCNRVEKILEKQTKNHSTTKDESPVVKSKSIT
jgi:hypothetical protein